MKKLIIATMAMILGSFSIASAELGVNAGVSGQMGVFYAQGRESEDREISNSSDLHVFGYSSLFLEKTIGSRLTIGVDYMPQTLSTETAESTRADSKLAVASASVTQTVKADFEDLTTYYATLNVTENFYVKAGMVSVDVITGESLGTDSSYGNASLDGNMWGVGYNYDFSNGFFVRAEGNVMEFDGVTLQSSETCVTIAGAGADCQNNFIQLEELNGASGKISIGKAF